MSFVKLIAVVAVTPSYGIGMAGDLPWKPHGIRLKQDLAYFKRMTSETKEEGQINAVIMGRLTWESIPSKLKPLQGRINIVLSRSDEWAEKNIPSGVFHAKSLSDALLLVNSDETPIVDKAVVIGGAQLFEEAALHPQCHEFHLTQIDQEFECDTRLTERNIAAIAHLTPVSVSETITECGVSYRMVVYKPNLSF